MLSCKNCNQKFEGNFCPNCGQKYIDKRLNIKDSVVWVFDSIFNLDQGFLFTTKELLLRPGKVINDVLNGITKPYTHPFRHLFIWATVTTLIGYAVGSFDETQLAMNNMMGVDQESLERGAKMQSAMRKYMNLIIIGMVPFFAMSTKLLFRKKAYNYAEHLVVNAYGQTVTMLIGLPISFFYLFVHNASLLGGINMLIGAIVITYVYTKTFEENAIISFLKYVIGFVIAFTCSMLVTLVGVLIYAKIHTMLGYENPFA